MNWLIMCAIALVHANYTSHVIAMNGGLPYLYNSNLTFPLNESEEYWVRVALSDYVFI